MELRDPQEARRWILGGLRLTRVNLPDGDAIRSALQWALEMVSEGYRLPPLGVLADIGLLGLHNDWTRIEADEDELRELEQYIPEHVIRRYEDYVTGKFVSDATFRRGTDAVLTFPLPQRGRAFAFLMHRMLERTGFQGVLLSPSVIRGLLRKRDLSALPDEVEAETWHILAEQYGELTELFLRSGNALSMADILELERGIAISGFGQRLAFRQVIEASEAFQRLIKPVRPTARLRRQDVATSLTEDDAYPVGGFGSLTSHGTLESLLNSQLAYMEDEQRPDLFDIKFLRGELLYYSRDENQFLRRRYQYSFVLSSDLMETRLKSELPWQDVVALLAVCYTVVRRLTAWLSSETLHFEIIVPDASLQLEESLLSILLRDLIETDVVSIRRADTVGWLEEFDGGRTRARSRALVLSRDAELISSPDHDIANLTCQSSVPRLRWADGTQLELDRRSPMESWQYVTTSLLEAWI